MTAPRWSREELLALARGRRLLALDASAAALAPPAWLAAVAERVVGPDSSEALERFHPSDRGRLIDLYVSVTDKPGEPVVDRFRALVDERWLHLETTAVNLLDDPAVGCILMISREIEGEAISEPDHDIEAGHDSTDWMLLTLNGSGVITSVEGNSMAMLGYQPAELVGLAPTAVMHRDDLVDSVRLWRALVEQPEVTRTSQRRWIRRSGEEIWIESSYVNRGETYAGDERYLVVMWDITARRAAEAALREREAELARMAGDFRLLADEVPAAVFRCAADGTVIFHNSRWGDLLKGRPKVHRLHDLVDLSSRGLLDDALAGRIIPDDTGRTTVELDGDDACTTWKLTIRPLTAATAGLADFIGSLQDISLTVQLRREATHDQLTGLLNRAGIEAVLCDILDQEQHPAVLAFVDLDRFKAINDTWGHDAGDLVLVEVAHRLASAVRETDVVGRWGGDEFVVVLPSAAVITSDEAVRLVGRAFGGTVDFEEASWPLSASIGVTRTRPGDSVETVIGRADQAMLRRKRGRHEPTR